MSKHTITIHIMDDDENDEEHVLPARNEVCNRCLGFGTHVDPNIDSNGITESEWAEWDRDDQDSYLNGEYDVTCQECGGAKVVLVVDEEACTSDQLTILRIWNDQEFCLAQARNEDRYLERMGF